MARCWRLCSSICSAGTWHRRWRASASAPFARCSTPPRSRSPVRLSQLPAAPRSGPKTPKVFSPCKPRRASSLLDRHAFRARRCRRERRALKGPAAMQLTGLLYGAPLLRHVDFPVTEVLGPAATEAEIQDLIDRRKMIFIKPVFKGGVGKKGKAGLIGRASDLKTALREKERLYFVEHCHGNTRAKSNGVTFEAGVPAAHEVYFAIDDSTEFRAPAMTLTHMGGIEIEEIERKFIANVPFEALTGLKAFVVANALSDIGAPKELISPLVQHLPKLWELMHHYGMTTLELNPIRMRPGKDGRLTPIACDFKCGFDRDDPRWQRLGLPDHLFAADTSEFEQEVNQLRTHQGQSDVFVINDKGTILAPTFGGGANSLVTEVLGEAAIISSDFGGNPPYEKMKEVARICYKHWLKQANVLFIIGGKSNNTDIFETFRAMGDALREY